MQTLPRPNTAWRLGAPVNQTRSLGNCSFRKPKGHFAGGEDIVGGNLADISRRSGPRLK